jgi:hypothetical protein
MQDLSSQRDSTAKAISSKQVEAKDKALGIANDKHFSSS